MQDRPGADAEPPLLRLTIEGTAEAVSSALHALFVGPDRLPLPPETGEDAQIVLAEAMNNIVEHAYAGAGGRIEVSFWQRADGLHCRLVDNGAPMPGALPGAVLPDAADSDDLPEGGFGWYLIRQLAREVEHRRMNDLNCLTFRIPGKQSGYAAGSSAQVWDNAANWP